MIHDMTYRQAILFAPVSIWFSLGLSAPGNAHSRLAPQSTPKLRVFVSGFPHLSASVLQDAESEAVRLLRPAQIQLQWIDCNSRTGPASCQLPLAQTDLVVRFLPKALPQASARALGLAECSTGYATAFIFYDRVLALRTHTRPLSAMLGRVLAHEITHLLLPHENHSALGLMRSEWSIDDLHITSSACLGLSARAVQFMHEEALRRMSSAQTVGK
jgi:hypothetical protein